MATTAERKNLLLSKFALLERMERLLDEQRRNLSADDIVRLAAQCREVDRIIQEINGIDEQLAGISTDGDIQKTAFDEEVDRAVSMIVELAERNRQSINELLRRLGVRQAEFRGELDSAVAPGQIRGSGPSETGRQIYIDRHN